MTLHLTIPLASAAGTCLEARLVVVGHLQHQAPSVLLFKARRRHSPLRVFFHAQPVGRLVARCSQRRRDNSGMVTAVTRLAVEGNGVKGRISIVRCVEANLHVDSRAYVDSVVPAELDVI